MGLMGSDLLGLGTNDPESSGIGRFVSIKQKQFETCSS